MPRQFGYITWEDDSLRPGKKQGGGWHQNLFDEEGKLKGSAGFVPCDESELEQLVDPGDVYITSDTRRDAPLNDETIELIGSLVALLALVSAEKAWPHVKRWGKKGMEGLRSKKKFRRSKRIEVLQDREARPEINVDSPSNLVELGEGTTRQKMSAAEAQARMVASVAAQAFAEEQLRMVNGAEIVDVEDLDEVRAQLASIPQQELEGLVIRLARQPELLGEDGLAKLTAWLHRQQFELSPGQMDEHPAEATLLERGKNPSKER